MDTVALTLNGTDVLASHLKQQVVEACARSHSSMPEVVHEPGEEIQRASLRLRQAAAKLEEFGIHRVSSSKKGRHEGCYENMFEKISPKEFLEGNQLEAQDDLQIKSKEVTADKYDGHVEASSTFITMAASDSASTIHCTSKNTEDPLQDLQEKDAASDTGCCVVVKDRRNVMRRSRNGSSRRLLLKKSASKRGKAYETCTDEDLSRESDVGVKDAGRSDAKKPAVSPTNEGTSNLVPRQESSEWKGSPNCPLMRSSSANNMRQQKTASRRRASSGLKTARSDTNLLRRSQTSEQQNAVFEAAANRHDSRVKRDTILNLLSLPHTDKHQVRRDRYTEVAARVQKKEGKLSSCKAKEKATQQHFLSSCVLNATTASTQWDL